jgi:hypothetical protein
VGNGRRKRGREGRGGTEEGKSREWGEDGKRGGEEVEGKGGVGWKKGEGWTVRRKIEGEEKE